jgi:hypothetical protein
MMVNSVGKKIAEVDQAYMAGLFDADGAIMACIEYHKEKKFRFRIRLFIKITQKNQEFLSEIRNELGWGRVRLNRQVYELNIRDQHDVCKFINFVYPYVRIKNKQLDIGKQILSKTIRSRNDLLSVARLADALSGYNVRSLNRRKNYTSKIEAFFSSND